MSSTRRKPLPPPGPSPSTLRHTPQQHQQGGYQGQGGYPYRQHEQTGYQDGYPQQGGGGY